jgi:leukotriene-A4 hydrolase
LRILTAAAIVLIARTAMSESIVSAAQPGVGGGRIEVAPILTSAEAHDPHSYARPEVARVTHVALDLNLDFAAHRVEGTATLDVLAAPGAREVVLDSKDLDIQSVTDTAGASLPLVVNSPDPEKGTALRIGLNPPAGQSAGMRHIVIRYRSAADAPALQWLTAQQTAGGRQPYLFSQGEPTLNRSWIPTQDSPGIRQTWEARITAPAALTVVMSGERLSPRGEAADRGPGGERRRAFRFRMTHPVAPYLIALAAGDLAFRSLGPRTGVWTEPAMLERAAAELVDTERMVQAAERLYGPYRWGRYDVIVLPPSFPYGGMENPTLTFLTPTFIAGDRSLVGVVAHELAHSWSGNLVTNATWADSWLNEGFTSYFENRIMEALYGPHRAAQEAALSHDDMMASFTEAGMNSPRTRLHLAAAEATPDGGLGGIVYDKGALFLRTIEQIVGRARFDIYLRSYFDRHAFQPMTSARFLADLRTRLIRGDAALERRLTLDQWVYETGLPANAARPEPSAFAEADAAASAFTAGGAPDAHAWGGWTAAERLRFVNHLPRQLAAERLAALDAALGLNRATNNEILFAWLSLALANRYEPAVPTAERFLAAVGRRKFVLPLFQTLWAQGEWGRPIAQRIYARTRAGYHAVTAGSVDRLMGRPAG